AAEGVGADRALPGGNRSDQLGDPLGVGLLADPVADDRGYGCADPLADGRPRGAQVGEGLGPDSDAEAGGAAARIEASEGRRLEGAELVNCDEGADAIPHQGAGGSAEVEKDHLGDRATDVAGAVGVEAEVGHLAALDRPAEVEGPGAKPGRVEV